ncbi:MAG: glycoside hydrolase family 44 protein [Planctomycetota bacterium]
MRMAAAACLSGPWLALTGCGPGKAIAVRVDTASPGVAVSPYIYGIDADAAAAAGGLRFQRFGDARWSTYNWETNASNGGSAEGHRNDGRLAASASPGAAVAQRVLEAWRQDDAALVTIPLTGWVAGDQAGPVREGAPRELRFRRSVARKDAPFAQAPDPDDGRVHQDEFVHWAETVLRDAPSRELWYALDDEPDRWPQAHPRVRSSSTRYDELGELAVEYAVAIKDVAPEALVFGPAVSGYAGVDSLRNAPDSLGNGPFLAWYLDHLAQARRGEGRRLVDVIDVHHLSEARSEDDTRVTFGGAEDHRPEVAQARLHAARSLYDPTYAEDSPVVRDVLGGGAMQLLPRLQAMIAASQPDLKLAIGSYSFGGAGHISGGVAQAEALGAFAGQGVFAAAWRRMENRFGLLEYVYGAFAAYTDYDGEGSGFGDWALAVEVAEPDKVAAFVGSNSGGVKLVAVLINRTGASQRVELDFAGGFKWSGYRRFEMRDGQPYPVASDAEVSVLEKTGGTRLVLPSTSVTVVEFTGGGVAAVAGG